GYLLDEPPDMTPSFPRTGVSGHAGAVHGPVLGDLRSFMFVQMFSRALTEDELLVHTKLAEAAIACGRADVVIPKLERLVAMHPYRESLWKQLMLGYYVNEYQSAAIDAYHRLKSTLAEELGVEPAPTIRALYHKILRQLPMDDLVGRVTRGRVDLRGGNGAKVEELTESDKDLLPIGLA
ncbi:BTAD domain-containing putative transcriptional regulator, partial [Mycobacterium tuberculosis]